MMSYTAIIFVLATLVTYLDAGKLPSKNFGKFKEDSSLVMAHVLFRHGQRTPDVSTIYPKDPYRNETYYPYGLGALTNVSVQILPKICSFQEMKQKLKSV